MDNEAMQNLVNDYASELGVLHSNLVIERANNRALKTQLDKAKQELKELKDKQDTTKED
ncbi:hypothetical protein [Limosilactobacillus fermentum]|jgi:hypothetical protein|uniref:Uncharacterized protein n=2 Tax=root TaxID=1 RepID=E9LUJ6_9CAUD|nr:hypothetical protein [Limosilactobacillus fermentum]YP_007003218.1 hypothetical protein F374_gp18 [Lactobacillus phage LF1]DAZ35736.1 MAG TPA: hypothetical protein [Caudoviricetes sp.]ADW01242.1 hypothetical protein [Lactobacillus phage LF1]ESS00603.1 hypothetical protein NB22_09395 [Limosilactobacillus fermentum NB-22]MCC6110391.1 hypothetical protein [Limosilactobacillus fermentum]MCH5396333.1 hypothetical protein [Limosilactobacillus fermentum]